MDQLATLFYSRMDIYIYITRSQLRSNKDEVVLSGYRESVHLSKQWALM